MEERILTNCQIQKFSDYLVREEKSNATCEKYIRDIHGFWMFSGNSQVTKELVVAWKKKLIEQGYAVRSINSMLASVNSLLSFLGWHDCKVKNIRLQRQTYCAEEKELTKAEYLRLLQASQKNEQLNLVLQTICGTGIRVSELRYFTVEAVRRGEITVNCKSKTRTILVPGQLRKLLLNFAKQEQWLASLVGEEVGQDDVESAYELAVANGYTGAEVEWIETIIGVPVAEIQESPYVLACENGFEGSLVEWLTEIADKPENLGKSNGKYQKTEYELACEYGYVGTFIEWIVSVANDRVFE